MFKIKKKLLVVHLTPCYYVFAFVALVSPLGKKAVARSHLRPFFCAADRVAADGQSLKTAVALVRGAGLGASDSLE
jgi:hypothetical protein